MENKKNLRNICSVRFSELELVELQNLLTKSKYSKVSTLIKKVLFNREIHIVTHDESLYEVIEKLSDLLYQYNKVGVNYNQTVKHIHHVFGEKSAKQALQALEKYTTELVQITEKFVPIVDELKEKYTVKP
jgi:tyrosine-protein phosphatase YwqE